MKSRTMENMLRNRAAGAVIALLAALLVSCGGSPSSSTMPGTAKAMFATGAITGFGSVHLNGKKFDTSHAKIMVNGQTGAQSDLVVGEIVEVKAHHDDGSDADVADEVDFRTNVRGPLQAIDPSPPTDPATLHVLVVLGQTVLISADTSFGGGILPASVAGLANGDILEVSGYPLANGDIVAMRVNRKPAGTSFEVLGALSQTNLAAKTFQINALVVDYSASSLQNFPNGAPADGLLVEVNGAALGAQNQLLASQLEAISNQETHADVNDDAEYEGPVTRYASVTDFDVAGLKVTTGAATVFENGTAADLATIGVRVEVEGAIDSAGILEATKIQFEHSANVRIRAQVDAVDLTASPNTVTVLGVKIAVTDLTRFEDEGADHVSTFSLSDLQKLTWIEVRASQSPPGSNQLLANRIERLETQSQVELGGPVTVVALPQLTILRIPVDATGALFFDASGTSTTAAGFFSGLVGQYATVKGAWNGTTLVATSASLSNEWD